ncbi:MAG: chromate efflux transporter [Terracidiphilus sp.]|nr:chromate efflux transporter [Terracidiphilus sp.]
MTAPRPRASLAELFRVFLHLGLIGFGGPAAHLALMEREAVERRGWLSHTEFLDLVGGCNLLPGPSSTQVAMALGYRRAGWLGLIVAGICFILPASLATLALAWAYVRYGRMPQVAGVLYGAKPVMVAIVLQAVWRLGRRAMRGWMPALLGVASFAAALAGAPPVLVLLAAGGLLLALAWRQSNGTSAAGLALLPAGLPVAATLSLGSIALVFLKLGVVVFGSGYVLLAFLQADLVDRLHWLTASQILDAVTAGQITPGPVFATATFLGYLLRGWQGAAVATVAIFLPSFFLAGAVGALASRLRRSPLAGAFLDGVNAAAVALMASVGLVLGRAALTDRWTWALGLVSAALLVFSEVNATWLILAGAAAGVLLQTLR